MFPQPTAAALNHLLQQNRWALPRLARFAGKTARFDVAPFSFAWTVLPDGMLTGADEGMAVADDLRLQGVDEATRSQPLGKLRGQVFRLPTAQGPVPVVVSYHPAYLLRSPAEKGKAWADLCLAMAQLPPAA